MKIQEVTIGFREDSALRERYQKEGFARVKLIWTVENCKVRRSNCG
jgi:hypothetical protein